MTQPATLPRTQGAGVLVWDSPTRRNGDRASLTRVTTTPTSTTIARVHIWDHSTERIHVRHVLPHQDDQAMHDQHDTITRAILHAFAF